MAVLIYTTPTCGFCKQAKTFMKEKNIPFEEKDVSVDQTAMQDMLTKSGQLGVPVIDVDGTIIVGFDQAKLAAALGLEG